MRKKLRVKGAALAVLAGVLAAAAANAAGQEHWPSTGGVVQATNNTWTSEAFWPDFEAGTLDLRA
ncbi:hypothetical protein ACGF0D_36485 [Kitasatospora sp. NPDC048298]|uniref:hypothetical protein n=1 Tax=Kitasatospora sp. NPDC048298 TaxID=3364049 RepID=UPI003718C6DB